MEMTRAGEKGELGVPCLREVLGCGAFDESVVVADDEIDRLLRVEIGDAVIRRKLRGSEAILAARRVEMTTLMRLSHDLREKLRTGLFYIEEFGSHIVDQA